MSNLGTTSYRTPAPFALADRWIATGPGETTHYHDLGEGVPVVFLHGSGTGVSAAANWWLTLPAAGERFRAIAIDLVGWGATIAPGDAPLGIRAWGAHVLRVLDALGIDRAWLVGNSLGGWIALQLALDHPERVLGVVSMGTGGAVQRTAALQTHLDPDITPAGLRQAFEHFVTDPAIVPDWMIDARREIAEYEVATGRLAAVMGARERDRHGLPLQPEELGGLRLPVLLIHGRQDRVIPVQRTLDLVGLLPNSDALLLTRCGHWSMIERADAFNAALIAFVSGARPSPSPHPLNPRFGTAAGPAAGTAAGTAAETHPTKEHR